LTQKEKALLTLEVIVKNAGSNGTIDKSYLLEKIRVCMELMRPEVLLSQDEKKEWEELVSQLKRQGKII